MDWMGWMGLLAILGTLGGVWLGSHLNIKAQRAERKAVQASELVRDASTVLGETRVSLTSMKPNQYAAFAGNDDYDVPEEITKRGAEADSIRPRLAALAVRWPEGKDELRAIERYMGLQPGRLFHLTEAVRAQQHDVWLEMIKEMEAEHEAMLAALDRAEGKLPNKDGSGG